MKLFNFFLSDSFQMTIKGSKLAIFLLLVVPLQILLFTGYDAFAWPCGWSRRSYRRWNNKWRQDFNVKCKNSKKSFSQPVPLFNLHFMLHLRLLSPVSTTHTSNGLTIWLWRKLKFRFHLSCLQNKNTVNVHTDKIVDSLTESGTDWCPIKGISKLSLPGNLL